MGKPRQLLSNALLLGLLLAPVLPTVPGCPGSHCAEVGVPHCPACPPSITAEPLRGCPLTLDPSVVPASTRFEAPDRFFSTAFFSTLPDDLGPQAARSLAAAVAEGSPPGSPPLYLHHAALLI